MKLLKISFQIQKVFSKEETKDINISTFSPNGQSLKSLLNILERLFLYCTKGGGIHVINTSDGEHFFDLKESFHKVDIVYCQ